MLPAILVFMIFGKFLKSMDFSDYIIYVDESGDHNLTKTDPDYPIFVLAFCIIKKSDYYNQVSPAIQKLKFDFFGHDMVILHENDIRKSKKPFDLMMRPDKRHEFITRLNDLVEQAPITVIATIIHKNKLQNRYVEPDNPYRLALKFCLERAYRFLCEQYQSAHLTHIVVESRGTKEDKDLELVFRRVCSGSNFEGETYPFDLIMADKKANSGGLQLADLLARPIGLHVLRPNQHNRAFEIIESKLKKGADGQIKGYGLKIFP